MSENTELFDIIFENQFFVECNLKMFDKNWEEIFKDLYSQNINFYKGLVGESHFNLMLKIVGNYYRNINEIKSENELIYKYLKNIPEIKFELKTRIKSLNSILEKMLKMQDITKIYDIDASTIILTEYEGKNILKLSDEKQLQIFENIINKIDIFYSSFKFYPTDYGNNYVKTAKVGKILEMKVKEQYLFDLNTSELPRYFSFHKSYENVEKNRIKEIHINTWETEKAIKGNTTLNHYLYKPCKIDDFLIFNVPKHLDIFNNQVLEYNLIEGFDYNFYNQISFDTYLEKLKYADITNNITKKLRIKQKIKC